MPHSRMPLASRGRLVFVTIFGPPKKSAPKVEKAVAKALLRGPGRANQRRKTTWGGSPGSYEYRITGTLDRKIFQEDHLPGV